MLINPWFILAAAVTAGAIGLQGYRMGVAACQADHNAAQLEMIAEGERLRQGRIEAEQQRDELARQLEIEANEDPVIVTQCLSPSRVRRLNAIH